jgi:hypothetical protein
MAGIKNISWKDEVYLSSTMSENYKQFLEQTETNSRFQFDDLEDLYLKILTDYPELSDFQNESLFSIFKRLDEIRRLIDPNRLASFDYYVNDEDGELLLFRNTTQYVVNLIIHQEDDIAFSVISKTNQEEDVLHFLTNQNQIEQYLYLFFSY